MKNRQFLLPQEPSTGNFERNRRRREKRILLAMVELQCRNHDKEGKKPLCEHLNKEKESYFQECFQKEPGMQQMHLCAECFQILHNGGRSIHHCRHMGYKTLCHHCPTPCHGQRLKTELRKLMQVRKHLFFHHPVKTMIHMGDLLRAKGIQHKERKKKMNRIQGFKMKEVVFLALFSVVLLLTSSLVMPLVMFTQQYALRQLLAAPIFGMFCVIALHKVPRVGALSIIGVFSGSVLLFMSPIMFVNNILGAIMAEILVVCFFGDYKKHGARLFSAMVYTPLTLPLTLITTSILRGEQIFSLLGNPLLASVFSLGTVLFSFLGAKLGVKIVEELKKAGKLTWAS